MRQDQIVSPGIFGSAQALRVATVKAINFVQVEGMKRGHGSTHVASLSAFFAAAKAAVDALAYVPVTTVTVAGAGAVAVGASKQLTATIAPAGAAGYRVAWTSANPAAVKVDENGLVTRIAASSAVVITATSIDDATKSGTASIT